MKSLLFGILLIIILGFGGLVYRNAVEHPNRPIACPMDALVCPDGTSVAREGLSCTFPVCPPPNVTLSSLGISFAIPTGFAPVALDTTSDRVYQLSSTASSTEADSIFIQSIPIAASSTVLATIQKTAISDGSGLPVSTASYTSTIIGNHRFTVVATGRFEGVVTTAYYLARNSDVLRFDAIDRNVVNWTDPNLDVGNLPANATLRKLLASLEGV